MAVTLRDIAKRLNLSHATVSFVLNNRRDVSIPESTRQRVTAVAKEMGYRPNRAARALVSGRTQLIALWMPTVEEPYYAETFAYLSSRCRTVGYEALFCQARWDGSEDRPFDWPVDGILSFDASAASKADFVPDWTPIVSVGHEVDSRVDHVRIDLAGGCRMAMSELLSGGTKRVALLTANSKYCDEPSRYSAYIESMAIAKLNTEVIQLDLARSAVTDLLKYVEEHGWPEGFFCFNEMIAVVLKNALIASGKPLNSVRAIACDKLSLYRQMGHDFDCVVSPLKEAADMGLRFLLNRMENPKLPVQGAILPTKFSRGHELTKS